MALEGASSATESAGAVYARLSAKKPPKRRASGRVRRRYGVSEEEMSVDRQVRDCVAFAESIGVTIDPTNVYLDNFRSAWKQSGGKRPGWNRMMGAAKRGEFRNILVWKLDRFTRAPRDLEDLIDLADSGGMTITGPLSGKLDLTTSIGRKQGRDAATAAAHESDNISERVRRVYQEARADGDLMGSPRTFGYRFPGDPQLDPTEAALLRDAARRVLAGDKLAAIAEEWNARGIRTSRGAAWDGTKVGRTLGNPRHGGNVTHHGLVVSMHGEEPLFDRDTFELVQAFLSSRRGGRNPTDRFVLSGGFIICTRCDRAMSGVATPAEYRCSRGGGGCGTAIGQRFVEGPVREHVRVMLSNVDTLHEIEAKDVVLTTARAKVQDELERLEARITDLEVKLAEDRIPLSAYARASEVLQGRWALASGELSRLAAAKPAADGLIPTADMEHIYDVLPIARQRRILARLSIQVTVDPWVPGTSKKYVDNRVHVLPPLGGLSA